MANLATWAIHLLTASGAALALVAALGTVHGEWQLVFAALGGAFIVDGIDGPLARALGVKERLPWFDGAALDFVVDYSTYVFVPALVVANGNLLPQPLAAVAGIVIAVVGALYFADKRMKTADNGFRGFPAVWNAVVYLLMIYRPAEAVTVAIIAAFAVTTFAPVEFVHPVRVRRFRVLTLLVTGAWAVLAILALTSNLDPVLPIKVALAVTSIYLALIGMILQATRKRAPGRTA